MTHRVAILCLLLGISACFSYTTSSARADDAPNRAFIRGDGTLMIDGQPIFPIGIYTASIHGETNAEMARLGFNMVTTGGDASDQYFKSASDAELYILAPHYIWATFRADNKDVDLNKHEKAGFDLAFTYKNQTPQTIIESLERWDNLPGVIGWYLAEEPKAAYSEPLEFMHELVKSRTPGHITTMVSAEKVWYHHFRNATDVLMVDVYPYRPGDRAQPEIYTYDHVKHAVEAMDGKPVWLMAQGGCMWKKWENVPPMTLANYRNQAYLGLIAGAKGYIMFSHPTVSHFEKLDKKTEAQQWQKIETVVSELKKLSPILCDGRVSDEVRVVWKNENGKGQNPLTRLLAYDGRFYLLVSNIGTTPVKAQILGTNYGYPNAFEAKVFTGSAGIRVLGLQTGDATQTVNEAQKMEFPTIVVEPDTSGVFEITRRPAPLPSSLSP